MKYCLWEREDKEFEERVDDWITSCGRDYFINDGSSPLEKGWKYCPFCGLKIKEKCCTTAL